MAKKPINIKKPKESKPAKDQKANFKADLIARLDSYQEVQETNSFLRRRDVRIAMGVGGFTEWRTQFEEGYSGVAENVIKQPVNQQNPYDKTLRDERPLIQKANNERPRKRKPPGKRDKGKGGK